ncbi:hypothetical protein EJ110_NYTH37195 [Nymphaea thermarum]|nr:hypothetical protein EJ110_NYTH37195 [Nymphaea thermarum]
MPSLTCQNYSSQIGVGRTPNKNYCVDIFIDDHIHPLAPPYISHILRTHHKVVRRMFHSYPWIIEIT